MSKGWIIGTGAFAKAVYEEHHEAIGQGRRVAAALQETREALWQEELTKLLRQYKRTEADIAKERKSADWKVGLAAAMKERTTATNRWIGIALNMGGLHSVSRQVNAWQQQKKRT